MTRHFRSMITIYVTFKNKAEAKKIASVLLKKRLIACATFYPIESMFWWKGKMNQAKEYASMFTTTEDRWNSVKTEIKKMHSYDLPCIEKSNSTATREYTDWIKKVTK